MKYPRHARSVCIVYDNMYTKYTVVMYSRTDTVVTVKHRLSDQLFSVKIVKNPEICWSEVKMVRSKMVRSLVFHCMYSRTEP
jgi:hypothetical protein